MRKNILSICSKTIEHFQNILTTTNHKYIFIGVKGGGCNGLKYVVEPSSDEITKIDEYINSEKVPIVVCGKSLMYLIGTELKWKTDFTGSGIEFINPNAKSSCGCGDTFSA